jgi:hypothetical protein
MRVLNLLISLLALGAVSASAEAASTIKTNVPGAEAALLRTLALGGAVCGDARLCAYIAQNGVVVRSKNVASVTNPSTGVVCIRPRPGVIRIASIVPSVTVEWGLSLGSDLLAFYEDIKVGCPSGTLEVRTYDLAGNLNPRVAFTIVVD